MLHFVTRLFIPNKHDSINQSHLQISIYTCMPLYVVKKISQSFISGHITRRKNTIIIWKKVMSKLVELTKNTGKEMQEVKHLSSLSVKILSIFLCI